MSTSTQVKYLILLSVFPQEMALLYTQNYEGQFDGRNLEMNNELVIENFRNDGLPARECQ